MGKPAAPIPPPTAKRLEPALLGLLLFIAAEVMFFAGLLSAFLMFRLGPFPWPPPDQPRLPLGVTAVNTGVLLASGWSFYKARRALGGGQREFRSFLRLTAVLGCVFLLVQGFEWARLLGFGLTAGSSIYGGFFYALVGLHGLHVLGGLLALAWVVRRAQKGAYGPGQTLGVDLCRTYWNFVVGLWPVLFVLVYL